MVEAANYICLCEQMMPIRMDLSFQTKMAETLLLIKCLKYMSISKTFFIALAYLIMQHSALADMALRPWEIMCLVRAAEVDVLDPVSWINEIDPVLCAKIIITPIAFNNPVYS